MHEHSKGSYEKYGSDKVLNNVQVLNVLSFTFSLAFITLSLFVHLQFKCDHNDEVDQEKHDECDVCLAQPQLLLIKDHLSFWIQRLLHVQDNVTDVDALRNGKDYEQVFGRRNSDVKAHRQISCCAERLYYAQD